MTNSVQKIVVNWHLLEPCQFHCKYCYAEWGKAELPQVYKDAAASARLIAEVAQLRRRWPAVRLSFAGGEPLLDKRLAGKIAEARRHQLAVSIITNGGLLQSSFVRENAGAIAMLGVSIDSMRAATNLRIGRATKAGKLVEPQQLFELLALARRINPAIRVKINTVVNRFNLHEDFSALIERVRPDKWKALQVQPATPKSALEAITAEQFAAFRARHRRIACASFEDNERMQNSYLMIDPYGRFFWNEAGQRYGYSAPILQVGIERALAQVDFREEKFGERYPGGVE